MPAAHRSSPAATSRKAARGSALRATDDGRSSPMCVSLRALTRWRRRAEASCPRCCAIRVRSLWRSKRSSAARAATTASISSQAMLQRPRSAPIAARARRRSSAAFTAFPTPVSTRRGRSSSAPRRGSRRGWRRAMKNLIDSGPCSTTARPRATMSSRTPEFRGNANASSRRHSSSAKAMARGARRSSHWHAMARRASSSAASTHGDCHRRGHLPLRFEASSR